MRAQPITLAHTPSALENASSVGVRIELNQKRTSAPFLGKPRPYLVIVGGDYVVRSYGIISG